MTCELSKNFHGVGIGPLSKILAAKYFQTASQSSQVINWVKTKSRLAGNQIPFGGTRFGFV